MFTTDDRGVRQELVGSIPLDPYLVTSNVQFNQRIEQLLEKLLETQQIQKSLARFVGARTKQKFIRRILRQLEIIALNAIQANSLNVMIGMPRDKSYYVSDNYFGDSGLSREIIAVADGLKELGLLFIYTDKAQQFVSRLLPLEEFVNYLLCNDAGTQCSSQLLSEMKTTRCGVVLKVLGVIRKRNDNGQDRFYKDYVRVPYKKLKFVDRFNERESEIRHIQEWLYSLAITYDGPDREPKDKKGLVKGLVLKKGMFLSRRIERHYRDTLDLPLRFYGIWQQVPSELRHFIRINDKPIAELDFGCFFPVLLLSQAGINWVDRFPMRDAYTLTKVSASAESHEEREAIRDFLKDVFVRYCFDTIHTADNVIRRFAWDIHDYEESENYGAPQAASLPVLGILARLKQLPLREAVEAVIREYCSLFDGVPVKAMDWRKLQAQESRITELVLNECIRHNIPCLPIHDGYLAQDMDKYKVEELMRRFSLEVTGTKNLFIKIKESILIA